MIKRSPSIIAVTLAAGLLFSGCVRNEELRGYLADQEIISEIIPGVDNRESVQAALGTPSLTAVFGDRTWYYVSTTTQTIAFMHPSVIDQSILSVEFDQDGNVENVRTFHGEEARNVRLVKRETPTRGRTLGLLQQLFGNIGRFSRAPGQQTAPGQ